MAQTRLACGVTPVIVMIHLKVCHPYAAFDSVRFFGTR